MVDQTPPKRDPEVVEARVRRRRRWVLYRMFRLAVIAVSVLVAAGVVGAVALSRTDSGRQLVLERALDYVQPRINGTVEVGALGPAGLLGGAKIYDVRVADTLGQTVLEIDSLQLRYSILELMGGTPAVADLALWGPELTLARDAAGRLNLGVLLDSGPVDVDTTLVQDTTGAGLPFRIRGATIHDGRVVSLLDPEVDRSVDHIQAEIGRMDFPGAAGDITAALRALSFDAHLDDGTLHVEEARGGLTLGENTFIAELPRVRLPASAGGGRVFVEWGNDGWRSTNEVTFSELSLEDVRWLDGRIPDGQATGEMRITADPDGLLINSSGVDFEFASHGRLGLSGGVVWRGRFIIPAADVSPRGLSLSVVDPWLEEPLAISGELSGDVHLEGRFDSLGVDGALTLLASRSRDTLAHVAGSGMFLGPGAVRGVTVTVAPLDYGLLGSLNPELASLRGRGVIDLEADGVLRTGMDVSISATQTLEGFPGSEVALTGQLFGSTSVSVVDLAGTVAPLSLTTVSELFPDLPVAGEVSGTVSLAGPVNRLQVGADLETPAGPLNAVATFNARDLGAEYDIEGSVEGFRLSELFPEAPDPTVVTGRVALRGRGLDPGTIQGRLDVQASSSRVGAVDVDTVDASVWIDDEGRLNVEEVHVAAEGAVVEGRGGRLGVAPGSFGEGVTLTVTAESIEGFRPAFMGENLLAREDTEEELRPFYELDGIDIDTLPLKVDIRFQGGLSGQVEIGGSIQDLTVRTDFQLDQFAYGRNQIGLLVASLEAMDVEVIPESGAPPAPIQWNGNVTGDSIMVFGRTFLSGSLTGSYSTAGRGRVSVSVFQGPDEQYEAQGVIEIGDSVGRVDLDRLTFRFPDRRWNLRGPASIEWSPDAFVVNDFGLIRPGQSGLRAAADGRLARRGGESDFTLRLTDLDLDLLGRTLQLDRLPAGVASVDLEVLGTAESTVWETAFLVQGMRYGILDLDELAGDGAYQNGQARGQLEAREDSRTALSISGSAPLDLGLPGVGDRFGDVPINLDIVADSFPLPMLLGVIRNVEDAEGTVSGRVAVGGSPSDLQPDGNLRAEDGAMVLANLGIRLEDIFVDMVLSPDGLVTVDGTGRSGGTVDVRGTVDLSEIRNPDFDLAFWPRALQVVDRRDIEAAVTGDSITLTGRFDSPFVEGDLQVIGGTVFIEEFQRASGAVNFYDPFFFGAVDLATGGDTEALESVRNPFLGALRVFVGMEVDRGNWLRSRDMNVETSGALDLTFDRGLGQLVLLGDVDVVRGTYSRLPRTFNMTDGVFRFIGTPGFNPDMDVTAENRLQTRDGQPLTITANISGTLLAPQLTLSSDAEVAISEADLISYLLLGQPASALVNETQTASVGAGVNLLLGQVASQIGYLLAPQLPIDYLSVSQSAGTQGNAAIGRDAVQIEAGTYLSDEVFLAGLFQRGSCADPTSVSNSWGLRVEVEVPRDVVLEGFLEDRCTREGFRGLGDLSFQLAKVWGFSLYREWGY